MVKNLIFSLVLLGFFSVVSQITLLREFISTIFLGNELSFGIIFFNWMFTVSLGSYLGMFYLKKFKNKNLIYGIFQILSSLILFLQVFIIRNLRNILGISLIETYGTIHLFLFSFLIIFPLSFILGNKFVLGVEISRKYFIKNEVEKSYLFEILGMTIGGFFHSYLFANFLSSFEVLYVLAILNFLGCFFLLNINKKFLIFFILFFLPFKYLNFLEYFTYQNLFKGYSLKEYKNSIYGNILVTEKEGQYNFYSNGTLISNYPNPDFVHIEEIVNFPLFLKKNIDKILLISGGIGGVLDEILKHNPQKVIYLELDPLLIKTSLKYIKKFDKRIDILNTDGRFFVKNTKEKFDVIIMNLPPPKTLQINRFYTKEFFEEVKIILKEDGIFSFSLPSSETFQGEELSRINFSVFKSLREVFPHFILIPGDSLIFIASRSFISEKILEENIKKKKIETKIFNLSYFNYKLREDKIKFLWENFRKLKDVEKNLDFKPVSVFYNLILENVLFYPKYSKFFNFFLKFNFQIISILIFILIFFFLKRSESFKILFPLFLVSFLGILWEIVLIFVYQTIFGYLYSRIGILICSFMIGMCTGVYFVIKKGKSEIFQVEKIILFSIFYNFFMIFSLSVSKSISVLNTFFILILIAGGGGITGISFPIISKIYREKFASLTKTAGIVYGVDLIGSSLGAILSSSFFIPLFGIYSTIIFLNFFLILLYISQKLPK